MKLLGLYIHIPFCAKKCLYCDFLSFENTGFEEHIQYVDALKKEIEYYGQVYSNEYFVDSVFIGGGTPSLLDPHLVSELLLSVKVHFNVSELAEITIESNPKTLNRKKLEVYRTAGINRLSIGVQSLNDMALNRLGRIHKSEDFMENYHVAREVGFNNINMDLMFAIPEHTQAVWEETLQKAIELKPEHISFYSLQLEENTSYFEMFQRGEIKQISDELDRKMYHTAIEFLNDAGYKHYEISNCAKIGFECRHNLKYWNMEDYLGLGLGAHSFIEGNRFSNTRDIVLYCKQLIKEDFDRELSESLDLKNVEKIEASAKLNSTPWVVEKYKNTSKDNQSEYIFTGMRKRNGIDLKDFESRFGKTLFELYPEQKELIENYIEQGYIEIENNRMYFTLKGIDICNSILAEFV